MNRSSRAALLSICSVLSWHAPAARAANRPFDGRWSVDLVCTDTQDRRGLVKGYEYKFDVTIADGQLQGHYGAQGAPASVVYTGDVADDGTLEIKAVGNTGRSDFSVGKLARGTDYGYTLAGKLEGDRGEARRREIRPCAAAFTRQ